MKESTSGEKPAYEDLRKNFVQTSGHSVTKTALKVSTFNPVDYFKKHENAHKGETI